MSAQEALRDQAARDPLTGIWNRNAPGGPERTFPRTDEGWRDAWLEFTRIESNFVPVTPQPS